MMRSVDTTDPDQLTALWAGGADQLRRFRQSLQTTVTAPLTQAPPVRVGAGDMPVHPEAADTIRSAVLREATRPSLRL